MMEKPVFTVASFVKEISDFIKDIKLFVKVVNSRFASTEDQLSTDLSLRLLLYSVTQSL